MKYGIRSNGNEHGVVLTKPVVVKFMLDRVEYTASKNLNQIRVIDPAAGDGVFPVEIIKRLYASSKTFGFSFQQALEHLHFVEVDEAMCDRLRERLEALINGYSAQMPGQMIVCADFLMSSFQKADLVIGNPPYVRHENIPSHAKTEYKSEFRTFRHRSDLYVAFYEKGLRILNESGTLTFICSNRWLKNQYGAGLRQLINQAFSLREIIDLEETCPFEEDVIAYPAITTIDNSSKPSLSLYFEINEIDSLFELDRTLPTRIDTGNFKNWFNYRLPNSEDDKFLELIENQGFKIGIGVATGADKVFIRDDLQNIVEPSRLLPIVLAKDLRNNDFNWSGNYVVNPFTENGELINLQDFPLLKKYFNSHKELLLQRHVSKKNPKSWYKTIDKINPKIAKKEKILLPDISGNSKLFVDRGDFYPHHNLYYIYGRSYDDLIILAAILMSEFVRKQLCFLGNKMNGGYPRWQSQNLKKLRLPLIDAIPTLIKADIIAAYRKDSIDGINSIISDSLFKRMNFSKGQVRLFEPESTYFNHSI